MSEALYLNIITALTQAIDQEPNFFARFGCNEVGNDRWDRSDNPCNRRSRLQNKGFSPYIAKNIEYFLNGALFIHSYLHEHYGDGPFSFCDAGCGPGTKLVVMSGLGFVCTGIERDRPMVTRAKRLFSITNEPGCYHDKQFNQTQYFSRPRIITGDIRRHDYSEYDVVYYYCPLVDSYDNPRQPKFEQKLYDTMKKGAILFACSPKSEPPKSFTQLVPDENERVCEKGHYRISVKK